MIKKSDVVKFIVDKEVRQGRVLWVDGGQAGIVMEVPGSSDTAATVIPVEDCEVVIEFKGSELKDKIHNLKTDELIASIQKLKTMRLPRRIKSRVKSSAPPSRKKRMTRLLEVLEENPDALDGLIEKALKEEKE